jgi:molecular chaperone GrpE
MSSETNPNLTPADEAALADDARASTTAQAANANASASASAATSAETPSEPTVEQLTRERDDMRDRWLRAEAEMQNVRTRAKRDVDDTRQYAVQKFAADVVEAAENLRRGLASLPAPTPDEPEMVAKLREGFEGVERNFLGILERNGVQRSDPTGQPYDPNLHQAMAEQPSAEHEPGTVIQAWTQAWTLNGRLLKPAMVVVAKPADQNAAA